MLALLAPSWRSHVLSAYVERVAWRQLRIGKNWRGLLGEDSLSVKEEGYGSQNVHRRVF
jgi:hypothetical protein